ncbi:hypothetical protein ACHAQA_004084 [Verticillium albo-atrum]
MNTSGVCGASGSFLLFGGFAGVMWVFLRAVSLHLQICWQAVVGRNFMLVSQAAGWGLPIIALIVALLFSGVSFRFGATCHINHENSLATFWIPLLVFAGLTVIIQFATFGYCIKVYLASLADNSASTEGSSLPQYAPSARTMTPRQAYRRVRRVIALQWRGITIVLIIICDVIFFSVIFVFQDVTVQAVREDKSIAQPWIICLATNNGDKNKCLHLAKSMVVNEATITAVLILLAINGIWLLFLLGRWSMVTGWVDLFRSFRGDSKKEFVSVDARQDVKKDTLICFLLLGGYVHYLWRAEATINVPWVPDPASRLFAQTPLAPLPVDADITTYQLPLRTKGRNVVDRTGRRFKLLSVNWYGASDELFVPGGLDVRHRRDIAATIRALGFNSVRMPYADEIVVANPVIDSRLLAANPDLQARQGIRALDVLEAVTNALTDAGLAVILNNHITHATWCCGADPCDAAWSNDHLGPLCRVRQSEEDWIRNWETVMLRFVGNPLVIGADLRNEVRGLWGTMPWSTWAAAAERAGNRLLKMNPNWLIIVGGTESGNDLRGVASRPVVLSVPDRVVYSAHVYAWSGWGSLEGRFSKRGYASFVHTMRENWAYLVEGDRAPVWVGEFGAPAKPSMGDANYWQNLLRYLKVIDADFGYWAINPRKPKNNTKETYALVEDDWVTPVLDYRMKDMSEIMNAGEPETE